MTGCRALTDPFIDIVCFSVDWKIEEKSRKLQRRRRKKLLAVRKSTNMSHKNLYVPYLVVSGQEPAAVSKVCRVSPRLQPIKCNQNTSQWFPPSTQLSPRRRPQLPLLTPLLSFIAPTTSIVELFPLYQCPPRRHHVGTLGPALRAHD